MYGTLYGNNGNTIFKFHSVDIESKPIKMTIYATQLIQVMFVAAAALVGADSTGTGWSEEERAESFTSYPETIQRLVDNETAFLENSSSLPVLRVFTAFPETPRNGEQRVWPLLKGITRRLHPLLGPHATFYMVNGLTYGCRETVGNNTNHTAIDTEHCRLHCIRAGRYCAPQATSELPQNRHGRDILKEIMRRICFIQHYHTKGSPVSFYDYVETFERNDCFSSPKVSKCAIDAMKEVGAHHSSLEECLQEDLIDDDIASEVVETNLRHLQQKTLLEMPQIEIDGKAILDDSSKGDRRQDFDSSTIFQAYCSAFANGSSQMEPLACRICLPCQDVRTCLWKLTCDGEPLMFEDGNDGGDNDTAVAHPPVGDNTNLDNSNTNADNNPQSNSNENGGGSGAEGFIVFVVVLAVVVVVCSSAFFLYRDYRTKKLMNDIDKTITISREDSLYQDKPATPTKTGSYLDRARHTGASCRKPKDDARHIDLVDLVLAGDDTFDDDMQIEDIVEDESEWAENKRAGIYRAASNSIIC